VSVCGNCGSSLEGSPRFCPVCGKETEKRSDTAASVDPYVGALFAEKFRVDKLLGEGGMGRVYRATQLSLDKVICLKVLRRELAGDPETQARFQREAKAASRLNHPHSIQIIDFGTGEGGALYIAMEMVTGQDLQQLMQNQFPLSEDRIRHIMSQVLDALSEAHAQKIIHRDLKPENIMVGQFRAEPDFVKVLDFGIAQIQDGSANKLTKAGLVCGTPEYMSPEQARGEELDARSDLYSAGIILYQMAVGKLPFTATTPMGFVSKHLVEVPRPAHEARPEVSVALSNFIARALSKDRKDRPASALAMRDELISTGGAKAATPGGVKPAAAGKPMPLGPAAQAPASRASRNGIWIAAAVAVFGAAGLVAWELRPPAHGQALKPATPGSTPTSPSPQAPPAAPTAEQAAAYKRYMASGKEALQAQKYDDARKAFERAIYNDPSHPEPLKLIGQLYQMSGDNKLAAEHFKLYVNFVPTPPDADNIKKLIARLPQ
jgi:serine/threonine-protein kinase